MPTFKQVTDALVECRKRDIDPSNAVLYLSPETFAAIPDEYVTDGRAETLKGLYLAADSDAAGTVERV